MNTENWLSLVFFCQTQERQEIMKSKRPSVIVDKINKNVKLFIGSYNRILGL